MSDMNLYQGSKDVFLAGVRAKFDAIANQALTSYNLFAEQGIMGTEANAGNLFMQVGSNMDDGDRAVWRHIGTSGVTTDGTRNAGGVYPRAQFIRTYETEVFDPDLQIAQRFYVPEERLGKEGNAYATILNRAEKLLLKVNRTNMQDPFEVFNYAFTAPASQNDRFFVRGNAGLDGNKTALGERLISTQHARADGGTTISNAVQASGTARAFSDDAYYAAIEQAQTFKDDVGEDMPTMGGTVTIMVQPANGLVRLANEINQSTEKVGTANNDVNVMRGLAGRVISSSALLVSKYDSSIADTNKWFLVDESNQDPEIGSGFVCITFVPLQTKTDMDKDTDSVFYDIKQTKVYGWGEWRYTIGSKGDGAAYSS